MSLVRTFSTVLLAGAGLVVASGSAPVRGIEVGAPSSTRPEDAVRMVTLESHGVAELMPEGGDAVEVVHVRATITNSGLRPLVLDVSKARAEVVPGITIGPRFVNADIPTLPIAIIGRGERETVDFYFAISTARDVSSFEFAWPLNAPARTTAHARFVRDTEMLRHGLDRYSNAGRAATWWFDPQFAWSTYFHHPGTAKPRPPLYVVTTRHPTWELPAASDDITHECDEW
jgi:hypothetical protein